MIMFKKTGYSKNEKKKSQADQAFLKFIYLFISISQRKARTVGMCFRCMKMCVSFISQADAQCKDKNRVRENKAEMSLVP